MPMIHIARAVHRFLRERALTRSVFAPLLLLILPILPLLAQSGAGTPRGTAQVAVFTCPTDADPQDIVIISIKGSENKDLLFSLSAELGKKFGTAPIYQSLERGTPPFSDGALGLKFQMPIVKNGTKLLPISPFLEAFAPYALNLRMVFMVYGPFTYQGYTQFENADVSFKVEQHSLTGAGAGSPILFDVDAIIKNPNLTSATYTDNPSTGYGKTSRRRTMLFLLFGLAIVIGVSGGMLLTMLMRRWKAQDAASAVSVPSGGLHERKHDDA